MAADPPAKTKTDSSSDKTDSSDCVKDAHFLVTGFGKFPGCPANPTEVLVSNLSSSSGKCAPGVTLHSSSILKVSASIVRQHLHDLDKLVTKTFSESDVVVVVHFGVDVCATSFKLERRAFNEANFRLPDEDGFQPRNEPIVEVPGNTHDCLHTKLDVAALVDQLRGEGFNVQVSHDAGRYVCNYTYFSSLKTFEKRRSLYSLFVHVPSFHAIDAATQTKFVSSLFDALANEARRLSGKQQQDL